MSRNNELIAGFGAGVWFRSGWSSLSITTIV
jgi:hypothetical protein